MRNGYAVYGGLETRTIEVEESRRNNRQPVDGEAPRLVKRAKLLITLKRSADFFENMKKFNEIREENEKLDAAHKVKPAEVAAKQ